MYMGQIWETDLGSLTAALYLMSLGNAACVLDLST